MNGDIYSSFPIELIAQLEIIRGPGSVLYGTNAFAGVMNIVTKQPEQPLELQLAADYGSYNSKEMNITGGINTGETRFMGALTIHENIGDTFSDTTGEFGPNGDYKTGREALETVFQVQFKQLSINAIINKVIQKAGNNLLTFPSEDWTISRRFFDVGYDFDLGEIWHLLANVTYNGMNNTAGIIGGEDRFFTTKSRGVLGELLLHGHISEGTDVVVGGVYDLLKGDNVSDGTRNTDIDTWRSSFYSQIDHRMNDKLKLSAGFQLNKPEGGAVDLSPRLAGILTLAKNTRLKLTYGEAYRSPFGLDLFLDAAFLLGNPDLESETISTYSAQIIYNQGAAEIALTCYLSRHEDLIVRTIDNSGQVTLINQGYIDYQGGEFEYRLNMTDSWSVLGNVSYQTNESDSGDKDMTFHPNWMAKSGLSYQTNGYSASFFASYFGEPTKSSEINPAVREVNPKADSYLLLTGNIAFDMGKVLKSKEYDGITFSVYADNILDERIYAPEISRLQVNSIPSHSGRGIYATLTYSL